MCKLGDIILIKACKSNGSPLNKHSFIVIEDKEDSINGVSYDIICNIMSSFKNEEQKKKKLSFPGNLQILASDSVTNPDNGKDGFVKADQFYYFEKEKIEFKLIGRLEPDIFELLIEFIQDGTFQITDIIDNLSTPQSITD